MYRRVLSPVLHGISSVISPLPPGCRFQPTCSEYAYIALQRHGLLRGGAMAVWRLLRCHPFSRGGFDPVPLTAEQQQVAALEAAQEDANGHSSSAIHTQTGSGDLP
jgi:putative membrane protein insertion efficiency factor